MSEIEIGHVSAFFAQPLVAGIDLVKPLAVGDQVHIKGHTTDLRITVESMEQNNVKVTEAPAGQSVGIKLPDRARAGDRVYKIMED